MIAQGVRAGFYIATLVTSEPYEDKDTAAAGINGIRDCAASALIADLS